MTRLALKQSGYWGMWCFNALSPDQQRMVVEEGYLPIDRKRPEGGTCTHPAELEVETMFDKFPGPRFYCITCAIVYLMEIDPPRDT